jgi:hypothetical protein
MVPHSSFSLLKQKGVGAKKEFLGGTASSLYRNSHSHQVGPNHFCQINL